jgi:hypothetical protein
LAVPQVLSYIFSDLPLKILALLLALLLWAWAVLDRSYVTDVAVPVTLGRVETKKVISGFETREAIVKLEGKGRDLVGMRLQRPEFRLTVPEGRAGIMELKLDPADLTLPKNLAITSITPEYVELQLNEAGRRAVRVDVPTKGDPAKGFTVTSVKPVSRVRLVGPVDDVGLFAAVSTESLNLAKFRVPDTIWLPVIPPDEDGFSTEPETVAVEVLVEKEGARIFLGVPVKVVAPEGHEVSVEPTEAQIVVAGAASRLDELAAEDIIARIPLEGLEPGQHRLAAEIELPEEFNLIKCEPSHFLVEIK